MIWWEAGLAPSDGTRVVITCKAEPGRRDPQYSVLRTTVLRHMPPDDPLVALAGYFRDCVASEATASLRRRLDDGSYLLLTEGPVPFVAPSRIPDHFDDPCRRLHQEDALICGWPLVISNTDGRGPAAAPLLVAGARLRRDGEQWTCSVRDDVVQLNPVALEDLQIDPDACAAVINDAEMLTSVREAATNAERAAALIDALSKSGIGELTGLDPARLAPVKRFAGVSNSVLIAPFSGGSHLSYLIRDLEELVNRPDLLAHGPAAALVGRSEPRSGPPPPDSHVTVTRSTLRQDQAVQSAMNLPLTVVTGPPGTGKSQVIVNAIAAAVAAGQSVLVASKNNQAIDVVVDRLQQCTPGAVIVRAGTAAHRAAIPDRIREFLAPVTPGGNPLDARRRWQPVRDQGGAGAPGDS